MIGITGFNFLGNMAVICHGMYLKIKRIITHRQWYIAYWRIKFNKMFCNSTKAKKEVFKLKDDLKDIDPIPYIF